MIVPNYWAEAKAVHRDGRRQITLRRMGWSDESEADALRMAEARVAEAVARVAAGEKLPRIDRRLAYNGAQGLPIQEEVLSRHGDEVITRNSYGARCLNTPDVLFADVDYAEPPEPHSKRALLVGLTLCTLLLVAGLLIGQPWGQAIRVSAFALAIILYFGLAWIDRRRNAAGAQSWREAQRGVALSRVHAFASAHPSWHLRVYQTPAGLRLLAMHRLFNPNEPEVADFFSALGVDKIYQAMCRNQRCFRARLSAKPWRAGIRDRLLPRTTVWPIREKDRGPRQAWIQAYESRARDFAACRFVETLGANATHPRARAVQALHDAECRADSTLPLA